MSAHYTTINTRTGERVRGRADLKRLRRPMSDAEIERTSPPELANLPDDFWDDAVLVEAPKQAISLRVDTAVLQWFKQDGPGYQSRINGVLRAYVKHAGRRKPAARKRVSRSSDRQPAAARRR